MESLGEGKLEINFQSRAVIFSSEPHAKILGKIFGDNSVLFAKAGCLWGPGLFGFSASCQSDEVPGDVIRERGTVYLRMAVGTPALSELLDPRAEPARRLPGTR